MSCIYCIHRKLDQKEEPCASCPEGFECGKLVLSNFSANYNPSNDEEEE